MTRRYILLALGLMAPRTEAQRVPVAPLSVAIEEGALPLVESKASIAALVRTRLERYTTRDQLHVASHTNIMGICEVRCPEWSSPGDIRETAKLMRVDVIVQLTTSSQDGAVTVQALAHRPLANAVDTLPTVRGVVDTVVAGELARTISEMLRRLYEERLDSAPGAAQVVSVATRAYLVDIMRQRANESPLGDLRRRATAPDDVEVRAWGGFGLAGTAGVVLRRNRGAWRAWRAEVVPCRADVAIPIADTASATTVARFIALAREKCGASFGDVSRGASVYRADTLAITELKVDLRAIERAWDAAVHEGLLTLPAEVPRKWLMMDGFSYVIEVRRGAEYRASSIEHVDKAEVPADAQVKRVFDVLTRLVSVASATSR